MDRVKIAVYAISGMLAALAGVLYTAQYRQGKPDAGAGAELDAIAAVVIGGTNLMGGRGSMTGHAGRRADLRFSGQHSAAQEHRQQHAAGPERADHPGRRAAAGGSDGWLAETISTTRREASRKKATVEVVGTQR